MLEEVPVLPFIARQLGESCTEKQFHIYSTLILQFNVAKPIRSISALVGAVLKGPPDITGNGQGDVILI